MGIRSRETSGWQSPTVEGRLIGRRGGGRQRKSTTRGGLEGWLVRRRPSGGEWFRGGRGDAGRPQAVGAGGSAGGGWRLRGVEFGDKLEALDFVSNG